MDKRTRNWLIAAVALIVLGVLLFAVAMTILEWDFLKLSTVAYETNEYSLASDFREITVDTDTADIRFVPSEDGKCKVVCYEAVNSRHMVEVRENCLFIQVTDTRAWYDHIGFHFGRPEITVYLPSGNYGTLSVMGDTGNVDVPAAYTFNSIDIGLSTGHMTVGASAAENISLRASTGDVLLDKVSAVRVDITTSTGRITVSDLDCSGAVELHVSTGKAEVKAVRCASFRSTGSTGDLLMADVIAAETFFIRRSTGDVKFDGCDASGITVETDTGDVSGTLRSDKLFRIETGTGDVRIPDTSSGGSCKITTSTGDITLDIQ